VCVCVCVRARACACVSVRVCLRAGEQYNFGFRYMCAPPGHFLPIELACTGAEQKRKSVTAHLLDRHNLPRVIIQALEHAPKRARADQLALGPAQGDGLRRQPPIVVVRGHLLLLLLLMLLRGLPVRLHLLLLVVLVVEGVRAGGGGRQLHPRPIGGRAIGGGVRRAAGGLLLGRLLGRLLLGVDPPAALGVGGRRVRGPAVTARQRGLAAQRAHLLLALLALILLLLLVTACVLQTQQMKLLVRQTEASRKRVQARRPATVLDLCLRADPTTALPTLPFRQKPAAARRHTCAHTSFCP